MIRWRDPLALAALLLVPALAAFFVWARRRRAHDLGTFVAAALLPAVAPDVDARRRTVRAVLRTAAVLCLAAALAGPMWGFQWQEVHRQGIDLIVALDTSRSMLATDVKPDRLARAKLAVQDLVAELHGDRIGLVAFAGSAFLQCPLTLDYGAFVQSLAAVEVGIIPRGGTSLTAAIDAALGAFEGRQGKYQAIVLITDGEDHEGQVDAAAKRAADRGVRIYTVGIGTTEGELVPGEGGGYAKDRSGQVIKSRLDETTLQQIATTTGGAYLHATGADLGLAALYRDHIDTMEKRELASTLERRWEHRFQLPLALAFLLLLAEPFVAERRVAARARLPWRRRAAADAARTLAVVLLAASSIGWLDREAVVRQGNRLYAEGKYDEAAARYNEALVDRPDSALLHFNLGDAAYKQGKYPDALGAFGQVPTGDDDPARTARVAYNVGNTKYRLGAAAEGSDPQQALALWAESVAAYRRALGANPDDEDAKFNHEFVTKRIADLKKKLEEQQQQHKDQQDQKQDQQKPQDQKQEQKDDQQQGEQKDQQQPPPKEQEQQQAGQQPEEQKDGQPQAQQQQQPPPAEHPPPQDAQAQAAAPGDGELSRQEAAALLDSQRPEEVRPDEMIRRLEGAAVAEPAEDW